MQATYEQTRCPVHTLRDPIDGHQRGPKTTTTKMLMWSGLDYAICACVGRELTGKTCDYGCVLTSLLYDFLLRGYNV